MLATTEYAILFHILGGREFGQHNVDSPNTDGYPDFLAAAKGALGTAERRGISMALKKQEFYEGAALYTLARAGAISGIRYEPPFFVLNDELTVYLKYSTKGRSPWGFTFTADEQALMQKKAAISKIVIGLVCGADGVAAFAYDSYRRVAAIRKSAVHIACYRKHGRHYEVAGPDGPLEKKVAPSYWQRILKPKSE